VDRYGNTSAASIPIALTEAVAQGRLHPGDKLVLVGFGAGLTWAGAAVEWGMPPPATTRTSLRRFLARLGILLAGNRSWLRQSERHVYNWIMGPVGKEDWRGRLRQRVDAWRDRTRRRLGDRE
jgi:3-oxoacyl-[acyl-carrier-protein] synthase-3